MTPETITAIIGILTPVLVQVVTTFVKPLIVKWFADKYVGAILVIIAVPLLSLAVTGIANLLTTTGMAWWLQAIIGLLGVFVNELIKQIQQIKPATPPAQ